MKNTWFIFVFIWTFQANGQLTSGAVAPDFNLVDIEGNSHRLYDYLDQGKTVYLDFFACHCPYCWAYHNLGHINNLNLQYGPMASNELVVLGIELDRNNGLDEFNGISGNTQGDWVSGSSYPLINPEGAVYDQLVADFQAVSYPLIYAICPDRTLYNVGKKTDQELYQTVALCSGAASIAENDHPDFVAFFESANELTISIDPELSGHFAVQLFDLSGRNILLQQLVLANENISLKNNLSGIFILQILRDGEAVYRKKLMTGL